MKRSSYILMILCAAAGGLASAFFAGPPGWAKNSLLAAGIAAVVPLIRRAPNLRCARLWGIPAALPAAVAAMLLPYDRTLSGTLLNPPLFAIGGTLLIGVVAAAAFYCGMVRHWSDLAVFALLQTGVIAGVVLRNGAYLVSGELTWLLLMAAPFAALPMTLALCVACRWFANGSRHRLIGTIATILLGGLSLLSFFCSDFFRSAIISI